MKTFLLQATVNSMHRIIQHILKIAQAAILILAQKVFNSFIHSYRIEIRNDAFTSNTSSE